jgi:glycosyltransferase involved in cell wall biosynthesis
MSEHEGFCLPLIEAMHFGCSVVAYDAGAVSETIGDGGIVLREKRHAEVGQLLGLLANDAEFRSRVVEKGHQRVKEFTYSRFTHRLKELLTAQSKRREAQTA